MRLAILLTLSIAIVYSNTSSGIAVAADSKGAITELSKVDADFAYQGEYSGSALIELPSRSCVWRHVGLQVIALGSGKFDGVLYQGGLPGAGWWRGQPQWKFTGELKDGAATLKAENGQSLVVNGQCAKYVDSPDSPIDDLGTLSKVYRVSPTLGWSAPSHAEVLFDGSDTSKLVDAQIVNGLLQIVPESRKNIFTKKAYKDFTLHLEFRLPYMPHARGQGRSNSGVYIQQRYETQILDSFGLEGVHNECGGLYKQKAPDVNMCFPPMSWQTYDINFRAARFDGEGKRTEKARLTVRHNGVLIHNDYELVNKTGAGQKEGPKALPTKLQNHSNPVMFQNIWIIDGAGTPQHVACQPKKQSLLRRLFGSN